MKIFPLSSYQGEGGYLEENYWGGGKRHLCPKIISPHDTHLGRTKRKKGPVKHLEGGGGGGV